MDLKEIERFIGKQDVSFVCSVDDDGFPNVKAMLKPRKRNGLKEFWFSTNTSSLRVRHFRNDPKASVYFYRKGLIKYTGVLLSGYINDTHTYVPGPDGKYGYGGKCFPKDVNAFAEMTKGTPLGILLEHLHELNVHFRGVEEHI